MAEAEIHAKTVLTTQLSDQVARKMKAHSLSIEEREAAVALSEGFGRYPSPIVLFVACPVSSAGLGIGVVVESLCLK